MTPELSAFGRGALLGFSIAAPVGPIGVLCIRRTLAEGRVSGLATGLGAAAADGLYGAVAALGLTWITTVLAVFAGLGLGTVASGSASAALALVAGVLVGSAAWWLLLSGAVDLLHSRFDPRGLRWLNRVSGAVITGFGLVALLGLVTRRS